MKHFIIALAAFLFFIPPLQAGSDYYVGCVDDYKGEVKVFKPLRNLWIPAKKLIPIEENDTIKTGTLSNCRLLFDDGSCVSIDANTQLMMESLKLNKTPQGRVQAYEMKLSFGSMLAVFSKLKSKDAKFRLKTPNAVMSVRGTDICLKASATDSKIAVFEGEVAVSLKNEENQSILKPGQEASIIKGSGPVTQSYLSASMKREQARCAKLKEYIEGVRKLMNERENYLQERINLRDKKINSWKEKRKTKLKSADFKTDTNTSIK